MCKKFTTTLALIVASLGLPMTATAEYLYIGTGDLGFLEHIWSGSIQYQSSIWDRFYAKYEAGGNFPDYYAPYGGVEQSPGVWIGETRSAANTHSYTYGPGGVQGADFTQNANHYPNNATGPVTFWDTRNPTITQTAGSATNFSLLLTGDQNIYSFALATQFRLDDSINNYYMEMDALKTVVFQFQTEGSQADFSSIYLEYKDANNVSHRIYASDIAGGAEYLREYRPGSSTHESASGAFSSRVAVQWDLSALASITTYSIYWNASASSMSLQSVSLSAASAYEAAVPVSATWSSSGTGSWTDASRWSVRSGTLPQANGNLRFTNTAATTVNMNDASHAIGELIFTGPGNVTIQSSSGSNVLTSNTGISTTAGATGSYLVKTGFQLTAANFFDIAGGTVTLEGPVTGSAYGIVKSGNGTLTLKGANTFGTSGGYLDVFGGIVRIEGSNAYSGTTSIVHGQVVLAGSTGSGALGSGSSAIALGADSAQYQYVSGGASWDAGLLLEGDLTLARNFSLASGTNIKRLGATATTSGAVFSGTIDLTRPSSSASDLANIADAVHLSTTLSTDAVSFTGSIIGGNTAAKVTIDGPGTVTYSGTAKTYDNATDVLGRLVIAGGSSHSGLGAYTVSGSGRLTVNGTLSTPTPSASTATLAVTAGGLLEGTGTINRRTTIQGGGIVSGGQQGIGTLGFTQTLTLGTGGRLTLEIRDATGTAGTGYDTIQVTGALDISATSTDRFVISVKSLGLDGNSGLASNFDRFSALTDWTLLTATGGITGFNANSFTVDASLFTNESSNIFTVVQSGNSLVLRYSAVPEPSRMVLLLVAMGVVVMRRRRCQCLM